MKNRMMLSVVTAMILLLGAAANAKKVAIINFDKGGVPNDFSSCEFSLSEEKAPKDRYYLKVAPSAGFKGGEWWCGEFAPKRAVWDGFDVIKFDYFNESNKPVTMQFIVKPKGADYNSRFDASCMLKPGKGSVEIEIVGASSNGGNPMDWKTAIAQWNFSVTPFEKPIHIGTIWLATADEEEKEKK